jgi:hypothetical protein
MKLLGRLAELEARLCSPVPLSKAGRASTRASRSAVSIAVLAVFCGCSHPAAVTRPLQHPSMSVEAAEAARATLAAQAPLSFKMLHQVVAKYDGRSYLMQGYLLARRDGSFRVSASAALGPKLFDVAKVDGRWESKLYVTQLAERVDPHNLGRAVERIYFLPATGPLRAESGSWVATSGIAGEADIDAVEEWRDDGSLALRRKRYLRGGNLVVQVDYDKLELVQGSWVAWSIHLADTRGFTLELRVTGYEPGFPVSNDVLRVASP